MEGGSGGGVESGGLGDGGAYGAAKAGGPFDLWRFLQQPQVVARLLSAKLFLSMLYRRVSQTVLLHMFWTSSPTIPNSWYACWDFLELKSKTPGGAIYPIGKNKGWLFALIVFSCIIGEGYTNLHTEDDLHCIFNHNEHACRYGIGIGVVAFLACVFFFMVDIYFPQISNATDRKYLVMADLGFSALWTFLWFIGFCVLTNQWTSTLSTDVVIGADSARASIAFSFFSIFSWGLLITFALQRYRMGVQDFDRSYVDPAPGPISPYSSFPNVGHDSYQQPPFTRTVEDSEGYQPPPVY